MKPGVHERKWELDSLCYCVRLAYQYWKITGDTLCLMMSGMGPCIVWSRPCGISSGRRAWLLFFHAGSHPVGGYLDE